VTVRPATIDDAEAIACVHARSWQTAYRGIVADAFLDGLSDEGWVERWRTIFTEPTEGARTVVSVDGDDVTGFARIGPVRDPDPPGPGWDEIYAIYLDPRAWGSGVGSRLMVEILDTVAEGVPGVSLWVLRDNARARAFYERHGFETDGMAQDITIDGEDLPEVRYRRCRSQGGQ
jgi:ribosomal protein S18 acetylase RimI-like enzyme